MRTMISGMRVVRCAGVQVDARSDRSAVGQSRGGRPKRKKCGRSVLHRRQNLHWLRPDPTDTHARLMNLRDARRAVGTAIVVRSASRQTATRRVGVSGGLTARKKEEGPMRVPLGRCVCACVYARAQAVRSAALSLAAYQACNHALKSARSQTSAAHLALRQAGAPSEASGIGRLCTSVCAWSNHRAANEICRTYSPLHAGSQSRIQSVSIYVQYKRLYSISFAPTRINE